MVLCRYCSHTQTRTPAQISDQPYFYLTLQDVQWHMMYKLKIPAQLSPSAQIIRELTNDQHVCLKHVP